jgi:hypothetical protein
LGASENNWLCFAHLPEIDGIRGDLVNPTSAQHSFKTQFCRMILGFT